jgi:hypothetical protein
MFLRDIDEMKKICDGWGIKYRENFASSQMLRPYKESKGAYQKVTDAGKLCYLRRCYKYAAKDEI